MTRRDYGTGTITERGPNRFELRYELTPDPLTGKRRRKTETFRGTKKAASQRLAQLTAVTSARGGDIPLGEAITRWRRVTKHEAATVRNYDLAVKTIPARMLATPIAKIRAGDIAEIVEAVEAEHNVHRARLVHAVISGALTRAWKWEWIAANPARRITPPAAPSRADTQPSPDQVRALLALVADDAQMTAWLYLSAVVGGRRGEVLALRWSHVDLDIGEVWIAQALDPIKGTAKTTKTRTQRRVSIGGDTVDAVKAWQVALSQRADAVGAGLVADPWVFTDELDGSRPWRPDVATKRFIRLRNKVPGAGKVRLNDLRHFVATELLAAGVDVKTTSGRLGHTRTTTTTDTYGHRLPASDQAATEVIERRLRVVS
jgi:integrase